MELDREDTFFTPDEDEVLLDLAKIHKVKDVKNRQELSSLWEILAETFNKSCGKNYAKKQLQKRLTNITYKQKKQEEKSLKGAENPNSQSEIDSAKFWLRNDKSHEENKSLEEQKIRAEMAKEMAELKRAKAEEVRLKKEEVLLKVALANLREAEKKAELVELEVEEKKRRLNNK